MRFALVVCLAACGRIGFDVLGGASGDAADAPPTGPFHDITDPMYWTTFDLNLFDVRANGFYGATFDGRYIYMVPNDNVTRDGVATRYDTQQPFAMPASWQAYDLGALSPMAKGFFGGVFDGRYIYLAPFDNGIAGPDGYAARFDTQAPFATNTSWAFFDTTSVDPMAKGFYGMAFDGTYIYYVPDGSGGSQPHNGIATRYDPSLPFDVAGSWTTFDITTIDPNAKGFWSAAFDGTYLYLVPCFTDTGLDGVVARYDTRAAFGASMSWSTFDVAGVNSGAVGFAGAAFDGRFVYFVPRNSGIVARYDTQAAFASAAAWAVFDVTTVNQAATGFTGTVFDGRYVYFIPDSVAATASGEIARVDTQAPFAAAASWSTFDITSVDPNAKGYVGAAFDGRFIYLAPFFGGVTARFDARDTPALPARLGSFM